MSGISAVATFPNMDFSPVVFFSRGDQSCFSLPGGAEFSLKGQVLKCSNFSVRSTISIYTTPSTQGQGREQALYYFALGVSKIAEVRAVTSQFERNVIRIWTFTPRVSNSVRRSIYDKELELMDKYPDIIFDFNIVTLEDFSQPLIPQDLQGYLIYYNNLNG